MGERIYDNQILYGPVMFAIFSEARLRLLWFVIITDLVDQRLANPQMLIDVNWNYLTPPQKKSIRIQGSSQPNTSTRLSGRSFSRMEDRAKADLACCCSRELNWSAKCKASCSASCGFYELKPVARNLWIDVKFRKRKCQVNKQRKSGVIRLSWNM